MKRYAKRLTIGLFYGFVTAAIIATTVILVAIGQGYYYDRDTGQITGGGLVMLESRPEDSRIFLNGTDLNKQTPNRLVLRVDEYDIALKREGFRDWSKTISVLPSGVTWLNYVFLLPNTIETTSIESITKPAALAQAPNKERLAIATNGSSAGIRLLRAGSSESTPLYNLPRDLIRQKAAITRLEWIDNQRLLFELTIGKTTSARLLDIEAPEQIITLPTWEALAVNPQNWREVYGLDDGDLRRFNADTNQASSVLAANINAFAIDDEDVYAVEQLKRSARLVIIEPNARPKTMVEALPKHQFKLASARFQGKLNLALINSKTATATIYTEVESRLATVQRGIPASEVTISPTKRFMVFKEGNKFATYDFEFGQIAHFSLAQQSVGHLSWFDDYHLLARADGDGIVFEYDGSNQESLIDIGPYPAFADPDLKQLYSIGRSSVASGWRLQSSGLTAK